MILEEPHALSNVREGNFEKKVRRRGEGGGNISFLSLFAGLTAKGKNEIEKLRFGHAIGRSCFG